MSNRQNGNNQRGSAPKNAKNANQKKSNIYASQNPSASFQNEQMKKELELENQIRDHLKCYICLTKVNKPKMCKFCKKICCQACIDKWLLNHDYCGICKHKVSSQDMITLPFLDDMTSYFINNIDNHPKNNPNNNIQNNNISIKRINDENNIINEEDEDSNSNKDICQTHNNKIDYYCIQCNKYYCSNCLVFFGKEANIHQNHLILQVAKMNDLGIKDAINEYKKLPETKKIIDNLIGLINFKLRENEIKKSEVKNFMNLIRDLYVKKIDETSQELNTILTNLKRQRDSIETSIESIPNGFNNIVNNNDYAQASVVCQELKKFNTTDDTIEDEILEKSKISPKLFFENYETQVIEIKIPFGGQYNEGYEIANYKIDIMRGFPSRLVLQYIGQQVYISFCVDIDLPLNAIDYPKFYTYITIRNQKYGLEFINLSNQSFPQDFAQQQQNNNVRRIRQQINAFEFDAQQFLYLGGEDKIIRMKVYIIKTYYQ